MRAIDPTLFPNVVAALRDAGLDPVRELIPVAPAAHYMMGGIVTDLDGRSTLPGPLRRGRGCVHGAARREPAGQQLAQRVLRVRRTRGAARARRAGPCPDGGGAGPADGAHDALRERPACGCGSTRASSATGRGLEELLDEPYPLAALIARSALLREETRGAHVRTDFPETNPELDRMHAVVSRDGEPAFERWE